MQKVQDIMLVAVQMVQGRCRSGAGGAGAVQAACTICTATSIISGAGRCRATDLAPAVLSHWYGSSIVTIYI